MPATPDAFGRMSRDGVWAELKRRHVVRAAIAYAAAVFVVLQVADLTLEPLGLPEVAYRWYLALRPDPDARFEEEDAGIRARLTELEARSGS